MPADISILTFNTGLLRLEFLGKDLYEYVPHVSERSRAIPHEILKLKPDLIALQEVFHSFDRSRLINHLSPEYPYHFSSNVYTRIGVNDGLMLFSRFPILNRGFEKFSKSFIDDRLFTIKGMLWADIQFPNNQTARLLNVHTVSGGLLRHPNKNSSNYIRNYQNDQIIKAIESCSHAHRLVIGDFNSGPTGSPDNYNQLISSGFLDTFALVNPDSDHPTWDSSNPLIKKGPHNFQAPQRIDHIFVHKPTQELKIQESQIVFTQPITTPTGIQTTLSDHYGLFTKIIF